MARQPDSKRRPGEWRRQTPLNALAAPTSEPEVLAEVAPLADELDDEAWFAAKLAEESDETPELPEVEVLEGPLPVMAGRKRPGRPRTARSIRRESGMAIIERMLDDPLYLENIKERLLKGKLPPQIETFFWQRVHGRPPEATKDVLDNPPDVKIVHEYAKLGTHDDR